MRTVLLVCVTSSVVAAPVTPALHVRFGSVSAIAAGQAGGGATLVYADFENPVDGKPVSSRGGKVTSSGSSRR